MGMRRCRYSHRVAVAGTPSSAWRRDMDPNASATPTTADRITVFIEASRDVDWREPTRPRAAGGPIPRRPGRGGGAPGRPVRRSLPGGGRRLRRAAADGSPRRPHRIRCAAPPVRCTRCPARGRPRRRPDRRRTPSRYPMRFPRRVTLPVATQHVPWVGRPEELDRDLGRAAELVGGEEARQRVPHGRVEQDEGDAAVDDPLDVLVRFRDGKRARDHARGHARSRRGRGAPRGPGGGERAWTEGAPGGGHGGTGGGRGPTRPSADGPEGCYTFSHA